MRAICWRGGREIEAWRYGGSKAESEVAEGKLGTVPKRSG